MRSRSAACRAGGPRWSAAAPAAARRCFAMEFLLRGAQQYGENGVFIAFEETEKDLAQNVRSLGFDLDQLVAQNKIAVDYVHIEPQEIDETGDYDLEGLFLRLGLAIDSVGAKRVVLDTIETLFGGFTNQALLRAELRRLFRWLKDRGVTAVITGERGDGPAHAPGPRGVRLRLRDPARPPRARPGLDAAPAHRQVPRHHPRHQRVSVPHRRGRHLGAAGHRARPRPRRQHRARLERHPAARRDARRRGLLPRLLDPRLGHRRQRQDQPGGALRRRRPASAASAASTSRSRSRARSSRATCDRSASTSTGWIKKGLLRFEASRPQLYGLEMHLAQIHKLVKEFDPSVVVIDPISNLSASGTPGGLRSDAAAPDRLPQGARHHGDAHQPHQRRRGDGEDRGRHLLDHRHLDPAARHRARRASATAACTCSSRAA